MSQTLAHRAVLDIVGQQLSSFGSHAIDGFGIVTNLVNKVHLASLVVSQDGVEVGPRVLDVPFLLL